MSPTDRPQSRPVMAQKMLQQSREAESALADALTFENIDNYTRTPRGKGDHSDDSETSSICSERSMDSFRRPNDVSIRNDMNTINRIAIISLSHHNKKNTEVICSKNRVSNIQHKIH